MKALLSGEDGIGLLIHAESVHLLDLDGQLQTIDRHVAQRRAANIPMVALREVSGPEEALAILTREWKVDRALRLLDSMVAASTAPATRAKSAALFSNLFGELDTRELVINRSFARSLPDRIIDLSSLVGAAALPESQFIEALIDAQPIISRYLRASNTILAHHEDRARTEVALRSWIDAGLFRRLSRDNPETIPEGLDDSKQSDFVRDLLDVATGFPTTTVENVGVQKPAAIRPSVRGKFHHPRSTGLALAQLSPLKELRPRISVIGVGGAGGNAIANMIQSDVQGVDFIVANTDAQALNHSLADRKIQLGLKITQGLGAGSRPEIGKAAAEEAIHEIEAALEGAHMCFIAAGMGGGTGTGAAPIIAKAARDRGILTVGVVTKPFSFEGSRRGRSADAGIEELQQHVDTLIVIPNQNLFRIANPNTTFKEAFMMADEVLQQGVRGITDLMVMPGLINLDFADVRSVMSEMGKAMMGTGEAAGDNRAIEAAEQAIANPLLDGVSMKGAKGVIISITGGEDMRLMEVDEAANHIRELVDPDANIIWGSAFNNDLDGKIRVSVVATGIGAEEVMPMPQPAKVFAFPAARAAEPPKTKVAAEPEALTLTPPETLAEELESGHEIEEQPIEAPAKPEEDADELLLDSPQISEEAPEGAELPPTRTGSWLTRNEPPAEPEARPAREGGTLFERMSSIARGAHKAASSKTGEATHGRESVRRSSEKSRGTLFERMSRIARTAAEESDLQAQDPIDIPHPPGRKSNR